MSRIIIEHDGKRYYAKPELVSVHDGMAAIAVKGQVPINIKVEDFGAGRTGGSMNESVGDIVAEMLAGYPPSHYTNADHEPCDCEEMVTQFALRVEAAMNRAACIRSDNSKVIERLERALKPVMDCFVGFFNDSAFGKPIVQSDIYADEDGDLTIENNYGGTNTGAPMKKVLLDCLNAVIAAQEIMKGGKE